MICRTGKAFSPTVRSVDQSGGERGELGGGLEREREGEINNSSMQKLTSKVWANRLRQVPQMLF